MKLFITMIISAMALSLVGCGKEIADPALVSQNRVNGKNISQLNAAQYARENHPNREVFFSGDVDSFVSGDCPQGDGYASWDIKDKETGKSIMALQCRTWELTGCFKESDSGSKGGYMRNQCNPEVPTTIQKVQ